MRTEAQRRNRERLHGRLYTLQADLTQGSVNAERGGLQMYRLLLVVPILLGVACGASTSSQDGGPAGVVADRFELVWNVEDDGLLTLRIDSDLPDETDVLVSVGRGYFEKGSDNRYSRYYYAESEFLSSWRTPRRVTLDAEAWKADLRAHQDRMASLGADLAFVVDRIEDDVEISATVHTRQDDPRFGGFGNPNLRGKAVTVSSGNNRVVQAQASFSYPLEGAQRR